MVVKIPTIIVAHFDYSALENAKLAIAIAGASIQAVHAAAGTPSNPNIQGEMKRAAANTRAHQLSTASSANLIISSLSRRTRLVKDRCPAAACEF